MSALFEPLALRGTTVPHRVWMAPMCQYSAPDHGELVGTVTDWHVQHLLSRAVGGAALVVVEATAVLPEGRISAHDLGLWTDAQQRGLSRVAEGLRAAGAVPALQLAHAGRKASTPRAWEPVSDVVWPTVAPSDVPFGRLAAPQALDVDGIGRVVAAFADAARRALAAGFETVEVHGAHGYLLHQFLSPQANHRTDGYGGDLAGRARALLEVTEAVRAVWPAERPLLVRLSATDWLAGDTDDPRPGLTVDETVTVAGWLRERGVDLVDVSSGGMVPDAAIPATPGYQVPFAARVRHEAKLPTAAVGLITEPAQAEAIVAAGDADAVLLGRALLREPYWPRRAALELGAAPRTPPQYARGW